MEVQILHYNTKYDSPEEAADATDGFAALSAFYQMDVTISNNLDYLYDILPNVTQPGSSHIIRTPFPLALLLPDVTGEFYRCIKVGRNSKTTRARETYVVLFQVSRIADGPALHRERDLDRLQARRPDHPQAAERLRQAGRERRPRRTEGSHAGRQLQRRSGPSPLLLQSPFL